MNMNSEFPYHLDTTSKKFRCPACNKKRYVRYRDSKTLEYLNFGYGRCDREESCQYHKSPYQDRTKQNWQQPRCRLPLSLVEQTVGNYEENILAKWLLNLFDKPEHEIIGLLKNYKVGTGRTPSVHGWPIFWQIDEHLQVRTGKLIKYSGNGRRDRKADYHIDWIHSMLRRHKKLTNYKLVQCLYGLHTIRGNDLPVAIVESEKTAIIGKLTFPDLNWLATGQKNGLNLYKVTPLADRKIILFPDRGCYEEWNRFADEQAKGLNIITSQLLEKCHLEAPKGADIADLLV